MLRSVAALVLPEMAVFEFGVICEVFGLDRSDDGLPVLDFRICGPEAGVALRTTSGGRLIPDHGLDGLRGADLVAVGATRLREFPDEVLDALRAAHADGATILSVCSGVFVLGAAGLLDGRRCSVHWNAVDELRARHPLAQVDPDVLFVDDGDLVTSAGTAAGIDACLHLVRRELGSAVVNGIARRMVVPPQRDGGQRQYVDQPVPECTIDTLAPVLEWMLENIDQDHTVGALAARAGMSGRTFARRFAAETGTTPVRWLTLQRVLRAQRLLEDTDLSVEEIARDTGFGGAALLRHHFRRRLGVAPADYRRSFRACGPAEVAAGLASAGS
ncbi:helix-turn-helix domain-containing protein [Pseudonocardia benzenivorans]|jgi:transcriptional regulator GlxA family with amidase domain|uniref:Transcriptional regulator, AraC family n=2 Tax=Pseudonocardia TaxID=1847 RepID=F4CL21_PSEUX|nr:helix-turn-helix domain-containing protein [Pseudonocardia dioxanivorans]AEA24950.1 transcriptional regulator, AraC family [Pseudonocardia dioxanivorans CB1190]